jgi:hypothetical protein
MCTLTSPPSETVPARGARQHARRPRTTDDTHTTGHAARARRQRTHAQGRETHVSVGVQVSAPPPAPGAASAPRHEPAPTRRAHRTYRQIPTTRSPRWTHHSPVRYDQALRTSCPSSRHCLSRWAHGVHRSSPATRARITTPVPLPTHPTFAEACQAVYSATPSSSSSPTGSLSMVEPLVCFSITNA